MISSSSRRLLSVSLGKHGLLGRNRPVGNVSVRVVLSTLPLRSFSSRRDDKGFKLDALPFSVSPEEALQKFYSWANDEQGLGYILSSNSVRIGASYCPVWSFDVNVRFVIEEADGRRRFGWKPDVFSAYGQQSVVHLPGLAAYAGYSYRRSLVNPIHNTSLVFLGDQTVPFQQWMLRDMRLSNGQRLEIFPDPWNTTRGKAFTIVREELEAMASGQDFLVEVQTEVVSSRRVFMPTYVIDYRILGIEYRAFVSGCDAGAGVSGESHKVFDVSGQEAYDASNSFMTQAMTAAQGGARVLGTRGILLAIQVLARFMGKLLLRLPLIGLISGVFVGFRKIFQPFLRKRWDSAAWERQREHETYMEDSFEHYDDFVDSGAAQRYFRMNRGRILQELGGTNEHEQGSFDWYKEWEEWARRQWQNQQQQAYEQARRQQDPRYQQQQQQQARQQKPRQKPPVDYQWDFDPNDP